MSDNTTATVNGRVVNLDALDDRREAEAECAGRVLSRAASRATIKAETLLAVAYAAGWAAALRAAGVVGVLAFFLVGCAPHVATGSGGGDATTATTETTTTPDEPTTTTTTPAPETCAGDSDCDAPAYCCGGYCVATNCPFQLDGGT